MLIMIEAIIREEKFEDVKEALNDMQINGMTVSQVMGCGTQNGLTQYVRGNAVNMTLLPKLDIKIVVSSEKWELKVIECIRKAAYTGNMGDGKIFSYPIRTATKIRTGETDEEAIISRKESDSNINQKGSAEGDAQ